MREIIKGDAALLKVVIQEANAFYTRKKTSSITDSIMRNFSKAYDLFCRFAEPGCIISDISYPDFQDVYYGEGFNEPETPLNDTMSPDAVYFLFAMTLGPGVSLCISDLFKGGEYLTAHFLDEICSRGIEVFADDITGKISTRTGSDGSIPGNGIILRYSPGYCGWHITGQKAIHQFLESSEIGISLTENCYMDPIKSISGVMIRGSLEMHYFKNNYNFCRTCITKNCRERLAMMYE